MRKTMIVVLAMLISACSTVIKQESFTLSNGQKVDYITGKVAGDGQEANFRDAFVDGKPVLSNYGSGPSLTGQVLNGAGAAAFIAGGMVGSSAVLRPTRINDADSTTVNSSSASDGKNFQLQSAESTAVNVNTNTVKSAGGGCKGNCGGGNNGNND